MHKKFSESLRLFNVSIFSRRSIVQLRVPPKVFETCLKLHSARWELLLKRWAFNMLSKNFTQCIIDLKNRWLKLSSEPRYELLHDEKKYENKAKKIQKERKRKERRDSNNQDFVKKVRKLSSKRRREEWELTLEVLYNYNLI